MTSDSGSVLPPRMISPTTPPDDTVLPPRSPVAPAPGEMIPSHYSRCYGCGPDHSTGLHLVAVAEEGLALSASFTVTEMHQGAPGLAHGGILSTAIDDALGALNWLLSSPAVTGRLEVDFRRPVPVGATLHIRSEVLGVKGRKVFTRAVGRLNAPDGPIAVSAAALFIQVPIEHFTQHGRREDIVRAQEDREVRGSLENLEVNP